MYIQPKKSCSIDIHNFSIFSTSSFTMLNSRAPKFNNGFVPSNMRSDS